MATNTPGSTGAKAQYDFPPRRPNPFFDWIRGIGIVRESGWIGGVCAGIGARLSIDAIIVRGILVVLAVLGAPVLLVYAAAWVLLPDQRDEIHLERLLRGRPEPALIGIGVLVLLSMLPIGLPFAQPFWFLGFQSFWTVFVIALIVAFVLWMTHRAHRHDEWMQRAKPANAAAPSAMASAGSAADAIAALIGEPPTAPTPPPGAPPTDVEELAAWREQQALWKREHDAWKRQQAESERILLKAQSEEQRRRRQEQQAQWRRERLARRRRTRSHPLFSLTAIGLALLLGATVMLATSGGHWTSTSAIAGLSVMLGVLGLAIVVNGFLGRRSGGASGLAVLAVIALLTVTSLSGVGGLLGPRETIAWAPTASSNGVNFGYSQQRIIANGNVTLDLRDYFTGLPGDIAGGALQIIVGTGSVHVILPANEYGSIQTRSAIGSVRFLGNRPLTDTGPFANDYRSYGPGGVEPNGSKTTPTRSYYVTIMLGAGDITVEQQAATKGPAT